MLRTACLLGAFVLVSVPQASRAQATMGGLRTEGTSYYVFARPGQNTIQVLVLGNAARPGIYEIGEGTSLVQLLALSGGASGGTGARSRREVIIRLYRPTPEGQKMLYEAEFEEVIAHPDAYPALQMGDVVQVEAIERQRFGWREVLRIVTAAASLVLVVERLIVR